MRYDLPTDTLTLYQPDTRTRISLPLYTDTGVHCGFPSPAMDYTQTRIDLNKLLIKSETSTFICDCNGDSMVDAFVATACRLIIDRAEIPVNNDLILVTIDGGFIVRTLEVKGGQKRLLPRNKSKNYPVITLSAGTDYEFWGVVTQILIDPRKHGSA